MRLQKKNVENVNKLKLKKQNVEIEEFSQLACSSRVGVQVKFCLHVIKHKFITSSFNFIRRGERTNIIAYCSYNITI